MGKQQLLLETVNDRLVTCQVRADYLQGHRTIQFPVVRLVNCAHSAFAKQRCNLITVGQQCSRGKHGMTACNLGRGPRTAWCPQINLSGSVRAAPRSPKAWIDERR